MDKGGENIKCFEPKIYLLTVIVVVLLGATKLPQIGSGIGGQTEISKKAYLKLRE